MILITGSTGLVGRHLLLTLTQQGNKVRALYRNDHKKEEVLRFYAFAKAESHQHLIEWIHGDILDIPTLMNVFKGITHVYHCAALVSFDPYKTKELTKINIEGTANIVNLCLSNNIQKLVHLSSIATLSNLPDYPITEENYWDPDTKSSIYALTKNGAEMEVWRATQEGLNAIILNPGIILGEGDYTNGSGSLFNHVIKEKKYYPTGGTAIIDVKDLIAIMIQAMNKNITQERYIAIAYNISYQELFTKIAQALHLKNSQKPLSRTLARFIISLDALRGFFIQKRKITTSGFDALQSTTLYNNNKLTETFNYTPTPLKDSLERISRHIIKDF